MRLVWYQRQDGFWNAACACGATLVGCRLDQRSEVEKWHVEKASLERTCQAARKSDLLPACGPKLPEPDPNNPGPRVFP